MDGLLLTLALLSVPNPLDELRRFPSHQTAALNYQFAEKVVRCLERELRYSIDTQPADWVRYETPLGLHSPERAHLKRTRREAAFCRDAWQALSLASDVSMSQEARGIWLNDLRRMLGEASYFEGEMPPASPWWRMRVVR